MVGITDRFVDGCEEIAAVDVLGPAAWIAAIPFEAWPQQKRLDDGQIRPSMVTDPNWHGFYEQTDRVVGFLMSAFFPGLRSYQRMLSVVMPGHSIEPHTDGQAPSWICRVHVPLLANDRSAFIVRGVSHALVPGVAYRVNTTAEHAVTNDGESPRIHLMFDVGDSR